MGPESDFDIKVWRKVGHVLTSDEVHFVSLAESTIFKHFETPIWNGKQNSLTGPEITGSFEKRAPGLLIFVDTVLQYNNNNNNNNNNNHLYLHYSGRRKRKEEKKQSIEQNRYSSILHPNFHFIQKKTPISFFAHQ